MKVLVAWMELQAESGESLCEWSTPWMVDAEEEFTKLFDGVGEDGDGDGDGR